MIRKKNLEIDKSYFVDASSLSGESEDQIDDCDKIPEKFTSLSTTDVFLEETLKKKATVLDLDEFISSYVSVKQKFRF